MNGDLASALVSLVADLAPPVLALISIVCWFLAFLMFGAGCLRLLKYSEDKFHAPTITGSILCFVIAAILVAIPDWMDAAGTSLFGSNRTAASASLGYGGRAADWDELIAAVLTIVKLVGLIAAIRGVFMLRASADGKPDASLGRAALHLVGGVCAWHIIPLIGAVQTTLGIRVLQVS